MPGTDPRLLRAKERLDRLDWWPNPVRLRGVRIVIAPWLFRLRPWRRFDGFATHLVVFLRRADVGDDLITHELCHIWQGQHRALHMAWKHLTTRYRSNPYEIQARRAVDETKPQ